MYISFHGFTCIRLNEKTQTRDLTVIIDPYVNNKIPPPGIGSADIVIATRGTENLRGISGNPFMVTGPGEYEIGGVMIYGITYGNTTLYRIDIDAMRLVHLGLTTTPITDVLVESLGDVDALCVPVGGKDCYTASHAETVIQKIQPRIVIPMAFEVKGLDDVHEPVDGILRVLGKKDAPREEKFKLAKKNVPEEDMKVVVLTVSQ